MEKPTSKPALPVKRLRLRHLALCIASFVFVVIGVFFIFSTEDYTQWAAVEPPSPALAEGENTNSENVSNGAESTPSLSPAPDSGKPSNASAGWKAGSYKCRLAQEFDLRWAPRAVHSTAKQYIADHVLFAIPTSSHDDHFRMDAMFCTWLSYVSENNIFVVTNNVERALERPGKWVKGTTPAGFVPAEWNARHVAHRDIPGWVEYQFRFFDAFREAFEEAEKRPQVRWVAVVDDVTFVNLNAMVMMLHEHDLLRLYTETVTQWEDTSAETIDAWQRTCETELTSKVNVAAMRACYNLPGAMRNLIADARLVFPQVKNPVALLKKISEIPVSLSRTPAVEDLLEMTTLWQQSIYLLNPQWIRGALTGRQYITRVSKGGTAHFMSASMGSLFLANYQKVCIEQNILKAEDSATEALRYWLTDVNVNVKSDQRMCATEGLRESSNCCGRERISWMKDGIIVSLNLKSTFHMTRIFTIRFLRIYYRVLYRGNSVLLNFLLSPYTLRKQENQNRQYERQHRWRTLT